ncbi:HAMP domain-containing sensor histidine kinase [Dinghuibacter silviterrae]|uniref:HAMP domain-containing sensor histidine kinase n=1 Tax=Dinghuibacter silviterrae TaxID=1539049 RepID=UPI00106347D1|nr:ATP-binding protein [Dinghuibacter silviterrae]
MFVLLVSGIIALLAASVYYLFALERREAFRAHLKSRANYSAQLYDLLGDSAYARLSGMDSSLSAGFLPRRTIALFQAGEPPVFQFQGKDTQRFALDPQTLQAVGRTGEAFFTLDTREAIALKRRAGGKEVIVAVAARDVEGLARLDELLKILLGSLPVSVLLTAIAGSIFARRLIRPVTTIIREVNDLSSDNLAHRIDAGDNKDELSQLADTFNRLLDRLQESFDMQRRFIANASHELSTPLTSISSQLEVALQRERGGAEYKQVLLSVHEDVIQLRRLTRSLLELAKADTSGGMELTGVRVDEVLLKVASDMGQLRRQYIVDLHFGEFPEDEPDCLVFGSYELLYSAFRNVVENGCKYAADHTVEVHLYYARQGISVCVTTNGNPINEEDYDKIFQPFFRGGTAGDYSGWGLGLTLARSIIRLHKGTIEVTGDRDLRSTTFIVTLPPSSAKV